MQQDGEKTTKIFLRARNVISDEGNEAEGKRQGITRRTLRRIFICGRRGKSDAAGVLMSPKGMFSAGVDDEEDERDLRGVRESHQPRERCNSRGSALEKESGGNKGETVVM